MIKPGPLSTMHPHTEIPQQEMIDKLLEADCSWAEAAGFLSISEAELLTRVSKFDDPEQYRKMKRNAGSAKIKMRQLAEALSGNNAMLIWLGKQRLNQGETIQQAVSMPRIEVVNYASRDPV